MKDPAQTLAQTLHSPEASEVEAFAAFARRLGVARSTVTRAAQAGRLVLVTLNDGSTGVRVAASLARWHASRGGRLDLVERHAAARGRELPLPADEVTAASPESPEESDSTSAEGEGAGGPSRALVQAETLRWQNALLQLGMHLERGVQLPRTAVLREAQGLGAALRALVERLIDQTAPRLAAASSPAESAQLLQAELHQARRQLRTEFARAIRRLQPGQTGAAASAQPMVAAQEVAA